MLDGFSCTECGRCQDACPALRDRQGALAEAPDHGAARPGLRRGPRRSPAASWRRSSPATAVSDEVVWDCVTCGACVEACPVSIEHVDHIVDLRRHLVMVDSRFPAEAEPMLRDVERASNPWGQAADRARRLGATSSACACSSRATRRPSSSTGSAARRRSTSGRARGASRPRGCCRRPASTSRSSARARACTGDPARRMGNEYVFQALAEQNVATLERAGRDEDRRELPALLQHARERVPATSAGATRSSTTRELLAELVRDGPARAARAGAARDHLPRLAATSRATTTCARRRASSSRPSASRSR